MKPYAVYKDSGIEWLGKIPHNRETIKLKYIMQNFDSRRIPLSSEERAGMQGDYPYYGSNGIVDQVNDYLFDGEYILLGEDGAPFFEMYKDVAFLVTGKFWVNNHAHILKASLNHNQRFLTYLLNCVDYRKYITGSTRDKLTQDDMKSIILSIAKLDEQKIIAAYLDHKTAQIDDLIAKKERMIELLKEERFAIINQAVTKGINPDVEYKDSGIEWLGKIPSHWGIRKLKQLGIFTSSGIDKKIAEGEAIVKMINYTNIYGNKSCVLNNNNEYMTVSCSEEKKRTHNIIKGDIIFTPSSETTEDIGLSALVNEDIQNTVYSYHVIRLRFSEKVEHGYKKYLCNNHFVLNQFSKCAKGTTRQILNRNDFKNIQVLIPSENEQKIIADFLDKKIIQIDDKIEKENKIIEALKEYRTALISEVVTGKIDVREYAV